MDARPDGRSGRCRHAPLLWGREDRFVPLSLGEEAAARLGWPLLVVDEAGHVPHIERPDAFLAVLTEATAVRPSPGAH